ncbi:hypothetical protein [Umezakia ovalisporum]|jgi:hypothetical protein|uniref:hypothetical protein n=1 Tax=Umezakia ovalisporum TaxID=75695 RepID=UPI0006F1AE42|nr:hypothetical protein [Umezakia ovalisporum]MBI1242076.1 hypothetical protein [Nostoc sp. RI_552]MDH6083498.1 hypothetical protein [Umezakia ovalisporum TAC611]MDH6087523.1 hypothetical protein [Umezakia ovalisporum Ak1311]CEJ43987.1 Uncharacterized protein apha_01114 [Umezakia ovalisporum]
MNNDINGSDSFFTLKSQIELELLETLLKPEDGTYPWNPASVESEAYFSELERKFAKEDWLDEVITAKSPEFYEKLDSLWSQAVSNSNCKIDPNLSGVERLQLSLNSAFGHTVPQNWLNAMAKKASEIFGKQKSMSEQLAQCVQSVLPAWDIDDLFVLTRPFAHAMRSSEPQDVTSIMNKVKNLDWVTLSEVEQAKISVAIADYAFRQLNSFYSQD